MCAKWYLCFLQAVCQQAANLPNVQLLPRGDGAETGSKHVETWLFSKVRTNNASCWFVVQICSVNQTQKNTSMYV
jgi:hypothetical protein